MFCDDIENVLSKFKINIQPVKINVVSFKSLNTIASHDHSKLRCYLRQQAGSHFRCGFYRYD